jgi:hypothetical protein
MSEINSNGEQKPFQSPASSLHLERRTFLKGALLLGAAAGTTPAEAQAPVQVWEESDPQCRVVLQEVTPSYAVDAAMLTDFVNLSQLLTGYASSLDRAVASRYLDRLTAHPRLSPSVPALFEKYRAITSGANPPSESDIQQQIMLDPAIRPIAEQVIYLWYVSAFFVPRQDDPTKNVWVYGSPEDYEKSLLWSLIGAHAPMTRGGPFGYWADAPSL